MPLTRTFISLPAGTRHVPILPFVVLTTIGSALWASGFIMIGLVSGSAWAAVSSVLGKVLLAFGIALVGWLTFRAAHRDSAN